MSIPSGIEAHRQHESPRGDGRETGADRSRDTGHIFGGGNLFMTVAGFTAVLISAYVALFLFAILPLTLGRDANFPNIDRVWLIMLILVGPLLILAPVTIMYYFVVDVEAIKHNLVMQLMRERLDTPSNHLSYIRSKIENI